MAYPPSFCVMLAFPVGCDAQTRARELVDTALGGRNPVSITKVRLSNKSYSPEAAAVIGEALKEMTSVTEVIRSVHDLTPLELDLTFTY